MPIRTGELTRAQAAQAAALPDSAQVTRRTRASDGAGGHTETWANVGAACACRVGSPDSRALELASKLGVACDVTLTLPAGQDVAVNDRVTISAVVYSVTHVAAPETWETARRALARNGL